MKQSPNILLIVADQQHPDLLGSLGKIPVKTPNLDRLANNGMTFTRAYTPCPLCTPARASIISGQYPSTHGAWSIGVNTPKHILSIASLLNQRAGYRTSLIGKSHFKSCMNDDSPEALPFIRDWDYFSKWNGPWYGFDHVRICAGHGPEEHAYGMHYGNFLRKKGIPPEMPYFASNEDPHPNGKVGAWALPEKYHTSTWVADESIQYLRRHRAANAGDPFFLSVNFPDPHLPFQVPEPWDRLHDDVTLPGVPRRVNEAENKPTLYQATVEKRLPGLHWTDSHSLPCQWAEQVASEALTEHEEHIWRVYMGMQSLVDKHVGRILDELDDLGYGDDTLVVYTSDHGDYMGSHWLWSKGGSHYDSAVRVPFIARWPSMIEPGCRTNSLISLMDVAATFMQVGAHDCDKRMQGRSMLPIFQDPEERIREGVLIDHHVESGLSVTSWVTEQYRLSAHSIHAEKRDELELYDLWNDPDEFCNLSAEPDTYTMALQCRLFQQMIRYLNSIKPRRRRMSFA